MDRKSSGSTERRFRLSHSRIIERLFLRAEYCREHAWSATMHRLAGLFAALMLPIGSASDLVTV
jgi:hypothetical protein